MPLSGTGPRNRNPRCATFGRRVKGNFPEAMDGRAARSGSVEEFNEAGLIAVDGRVTRSGRVGKFHFTQREVKELALPAVAPSKEYVTAVLYGCAARTGVVQELHRAVASNTRIACTRTVREKDLSWLVCMVHRKIKTLRSRNCL